MQIFRYPWGIRQDEYGAWYSKTKWGEVWLCVWCLGFWVGLLTILLYYLNPSRLIWFMLPFTLNGGIIVIAMIANRLMYWRDE